MSSSVSRRIYRAEDTADDVFVVGGRAREVVAAEGPVSTVASLLDGARKRAEHIVAEAEARAAAIIAEAEASAGDVRRQAREAGVRDGGAAVEAEAAANLDLIRAAASEGLAIRNAMIEEAMPAIARAVAMACRRVVGAAFEADASLTADACADAVRAAAGQQVIAIRVNPGAFDTVRAHLVDVESFVRADASVERGGCLIDLKNGAIDASLDARLDLIELALREAAGGIE